MQGRDGPEPGGGGLALAGKVMAITGAGRGIGRATAIEMAGRGAHVLVNDVVGARETATAVVDAGGVAEAHEGDVSQWANAAALVDRAITVFGDLHGLINNAGIVRDRMSFKMRECEWDEVVRVNLKGSFAPTRFAAACWRAEHKAGRVKARSVVNTTSESGLYGSVGQANYAAAKAGVAALTLVLAGELEKYGVAVNAIAPRARTPMSEAAFGTLPDRSDSDAWSPAHVANFVSWLVSEGARNISGQIFVIFGQRVELLETWSVRETSQVDVPRSEVELLELRDSLFAQRAMMRDAFSVREFFLREAGGQ